MKVNYSCETETQPFFQEWIDFIIDDKSWDCYGWNDNMREEPLNLSYRENNSYYSLCNELLLRVIPLFEWQE